MSRDMPVVVVTRHPALVEYLREQHLVGDDVPVLTHVDHPAQIHTAHVYGVLPLSLAVHAALITDIPLAMAPEDRGKELDLARVREIAGAPRTYQVYDREKWEAVTDAIVAHGWAHWPPPKRGLLTKEKQNGRRPRKTQEAAK